MTLTLVQPIITLTRKRRQKHHTAQHKDSRDCACSLHRWQQLLEMHPQVEYRVFISTTPVAGSGGGTTGFLFFEKWCQIPPPAATSTNTMNT